MKPTLDWPQTRSSRGFSNSRSDTRHIKRADEDNYKVVLKFMNINPTLVGDSDYSLLYVSTRFFFIIDILK